jgi:hypothetical protein
LYDTIEDAKKSFIDPMGIKEITSEEFEVK